MNSPYNGKFEVTQIQSAAHDGLDLVGIDSKVIHSTVNGTVQYAGYENNDNKQQGFGLYVCIKSSDGKYFYYGHMSEVKVKTGQIVTIGSVLGTEGSTGYSTGSHCHYCCRPNFCIGNALNISDISGIPNKTGVYDDGHRPIDDAATIQHRIDVYIDGQKKYSGLLD